MLIGVLLAAVLASLVLGGATGDDGGDGGSGEPAENDAPRAGGEDQDLGDLVAVENNELSLFVGGDADAWSPEELAPTPTADEATAILEEEFETKIDTRSDYEEFVTTRSQDFGTDVAFGTPQGERISGTEGQDIIVGWEGDDTIFLGEGDDLVYPIFAAEVQGDDSIRGGRGDDEITDPFGANTIRGDSGNDSIDARDHSADRFTGDFLIGGTGDDLLAGDGDDTMAGGPGGDLFAVHVPVGVIVPVEITDFDMEEDRLQVYIETDTPKSDAEYDVDLQYIGEGRVEVAVDEVVVARLLNQPEAGSINVVVGNARYA